MATASRKTSTNKEVAEAKENLPVSAAMFEDEADGGFGNADRDSFAVPFIQLLQKMSPQVDEGDPAYIEGAKAGSFFNTVTNEVTPGDPGIAVIPCHFERVFLEWRPRNDGGGLAAEHDVAEGTKLLSTCERNEKGVDILPNGNELHDTRVHYVLVLDEDGNPSPAVISMSRTNIKKSKRWMAVMQNIKVRRADGSRFTPPAFSHIYRVGRDQESNDQGSWYTYAPRKERMLGSEDGDADLYEYAKAFRDQIKGGQANVDHAKADAATSTHAGAGGVDDTSDLEDEVPF